MTWTCWSLIWSFLWTRLLNRLPLPHSQISVALWIYDLHLSSLTVFSIKWSSPNLWYQLVKPNSQPSEALPIFGMDLSSPMLNPVQLSPPLIWTCQSSLKTQYRAHNLWFELFKSHFQPSVALPIFDMNWSILTLKLIVTLPTLWFELVNPHSQPSASLPLFDLKLSRIILNKL